MKFTNNVYNVLKWIAQIALPAAGTLYLGLAQIWDLKYQMQVVNSVVVVDTFLGVLLGISSASYKPPLPAIDGHVFVSEPVPGSAVARMEFSRHPEDVLRDKKGYMTLDIRPDPGQQSSSVPVSMPEPEKNYD